MLWHRNAIFSAEPAWHVALCRQVWAQLERNNRGEHAARSTTFFPADTRIPSMPVGFQLRCFHWGGSSPAGLRSWCALRKPRGLRYKRMYSNWTLGDVSRCRLLVYNYYKHQLNASTTEYTSPGFSHEPSLFKVYDFILQTNILDIRMDSGHFCPLLIVKEKKKNLSSGRSI